MTNQYGIMQVQHLLHVGLVEGEKGAMDGDTDGGKMEVVEEDGHMMVETLGRSEMQLQGPLADTL